MIEIHYQNSSDTPIKDFIIKYMEPKTIAPIISVPIRFPIRPPGSSLPSPHGL